MEAAWSFLSPTGRLSDACVSCMTCLLHRLKIAFKLQNQSVLFGLRPGFQEAKPAAAPNRYEVIITQHFVFANRDIVHFDVTTPDFFFCRRP